MRPTASLTPLLLLFLLPLSHLSSAADLTFSIPPSGSVPNPATLPPYTSASLTTLSSRLSAPLSIANTFIFHNVSAGSYLLDIHCRDAVFQPFRVDVAVVKTQNQAQAVDVFQTFRGNEWGNKGEKIAEKEKGVWEVRAVKTKAYYEERSGCMWAPTSNSFFVIVSGLANQCFQN
jgi:O-acetylhomoserine/O-acetylserine sulfhydrylase